MHKLYRFLFCLLGVSCSLFATTRPCPGQFVLTGEWIYLHPIIDSPYYVIPNSPDPEQQSGTREHVEQDYNSGFRLEGLYGFCNGCSDFRLAWTNLCANDQSSVNGDLLSATQGYPQLFTTFNLFPGTATSKIDFDFNRVEGVFGLYVLNWCNFSLTLEGGLQYACFDVKQKTTYTLQGGFSGIVENKLEYWGVGPQFGLDFKYGFWNCLSFVGNISGALLVGETDTRTFVELENILDVVDLKNETLWRIVPNTQIRVGLNYQFNCFCNWNLEVGYEFLSYLRALDTVGFTDAFFTSQSFDYYSNADMHGPYVSLSLTF